MIQNWKFQRGDIFFTRFDNAIGSEQSGNRPAVVLQNDVGNFYSPTLIVATLTSKAAKKYTQPTHCLLVNEFLSVPSIVQAEQIFTVDKSRVLKYLGHLTPEEMSRVDDAVRASLALNPMGSKMCIRDSLHRRLPSVALHAGGRRAGCSAGCPLCAAECGCLRH